MRQSLRLIAAICLVLPFVPNAALAAFEPPEGCEGVLTVHYKGCMVSNIWTCEGDAPGEQWVSLFTEAGPAQIRKVDREFQWLETYHMNPPRREVMRQPADDPESLSELFEGGFDLYDFTIDTESAEGTESLRYKGYDHLPGETVTIDGEPLERTEFGYEALDDEGAVVWAREGQQYVSRKHRLFFFGESWEKGNRDNASDLGPVEFLYPGDVGFMSEAPKYECGLTLSRWSGQ